MDIPSLYTLFRQHPVICTDTRKIVPGSLFFALSGERFDGNAFAEMALRQGAAYAVVSNPALQGDRLIHVEDTLKTLQELALHHRRILGIPVIAITGSNGKTTTKELITAALSTQYRVHATQGNLNNHIGVPLTLLGTSPDTEILVCEMGANHPGEIGFLCTIAEPSHGIITNIGKAHLEGFGSLEGVQKAKGELFDYLQSHGGLCFVNIDDPRLRELGTALDHKITYGFDRQYSPDYGFTYSSVPDENGFTIESENPDRVVIHSDMMGRYNATNMVAAFVIARRFEVACDAITQSLASFVPGANRSEIVQHRECTIVKDAYNANPSSMELALHAFAERYAGGWVVMGDMKEVGRDKQETHRHIIQLAVSLGFQRIYLVGPDFQEAMDALHLEGPHVLTAGSVEQLRDQWNWESCRGKAILLKGSRSMHLEHLLEAE